MTGAWPKKVAVDFAAATVTVEDETGEHTLPMASAEAFDAVAAAYLRCGWDTKYVYGFSWMGRPVIQLPDDLIRLQEVIYAVKPDLIVEVGVAHGGSLVFHAGLCRAMGRGRVVGVDIEIRPHNRSAIEAHELADLITLIEGNSIAADTIAAVHALVRPGERVLVVLDGHHTLDHVLAELDAYSPLVSPGSYIIAMDGIMRHLVGAPRSRPGWATDNPSEAARRFAADHPDFDLVEPEPPFNEGMVTARVSYGVDAFLLRCP
ncbi:MAG: class I SAM-dependent methyltransferase [Rhodospirillaceae bacterium]|nr:class I SAM-dependent methyltransferase [Rhodospirillales bacterium]